MAPAEGSILPPQALSGQLGQLVDRFHRDRGAPGIPIFGALGVGPGRIPDPLEFRGPPLDVRVVQVGQPFLKGAIRTLSDSTGSTESFKRLRGS